MDPVMNVVVGMLEFDYGLSSVNEKQSTTLPRYIVSVIRENSQHLDKLHMTTNLLAIKFLHIPS